MSGATLLPDYAGGSILNLMRSIADACGVPPLPYAPARELDGAQLASAANIVLLVIDGLGYDHLLREGRDGALRRHLRGSLTSVFPSTTAAAIPSFLTGLAPQQHGLTGWHMYFAEIDRILAVLPLAPREGAALEIALPELCTSLFQHRSLALAMGRRACTLSPVDIVASAFNHHHSAGSLCSGYASLGEMFDRLAEIVTAPAAPRYVHVYYPVLDSNAHAFGIGSSQVAAVLAALDHGLGQFLERVRGSDTVLIATADHGFIDAPPQRLIELGQHPELGAMLARPLCGERRVAYCYVKPERHADFAAYMGDRLAAAADVYRSSELVDLRWFGPGEPHPRLLSRIGDYTLVMRDNWTIKDWLPGEKRYRQIGVHGGISAAEMRVPLIVARA